MATLEGTLPLTEKATNTHTPGTGLGFVAPPAEILTLFLIGSELRKISPLMLSLCTRKFSLESVNGTIFPTFS